MNSPSSAPEARRHRGILQRLRRDRQGATAIEFALVFPMVFLLTLGLIDFMLLLLDHHRANEAARRAVRLATILDPVAQLSSLESGNPITCTGSGSSVSCSSASVANSAGFGELVTEMQGILPKLSAANLRVTYEHVGLGDKDMPGGILPMVSVELQDVEFSFIAISMVPGIPNSITLPAFRSSMVAGGSAPE